MNAIGKKYGKLTIIQYLDTTWSARYICQCECGNTKVEALSNLNRKKRTRFDCGKCPKTDEEYKQWFLSKVVKTDSCWLWNQSLDRDGYGSVNIENIRLKAHRAAYFLFVGDFEDDKFVCHTCDNPRCVNPDHLFLGTHLDNERDKDLKGRRPITSNGKVTALKDADVITIREQFELLSGTNLQRYHYLAEKFQCNVRIIERIVKQQFFKNVKSKEIKPSNKVNPFSFLSRLKQ